ncbi:WGR domain-containing protein [Cytophagaceae bacterium YF14B1]|uniref:WGR domain-containing protein n=1 Tax=Xanthocytophaga flava TaxID=3048013 RepID=A0AAE3U7E9_9BACT|nr:WGR domain-containing protein [Xanthocytophaga flavus]MDJ1482864.1 WGR domain-containing protein [Xanthocytophaga flavus]
MQSISLHYREGSSDKIYQVTLEPDGTGYLVNFAFGRRGTTLQTGTKTQTPVDLPAAQKIFDKLVKEKTAKGYKEVVDVGDLSAPVAAYQRTDREQNDTGIYCQLLNSIEIEDVDRYIQDDLYLAQEKHDGKRLLLAKRNGELIAINRKGLSVGFPAVFQGLLSHPTDFILDGEAIGETFYAFDLLELNNEDIRPLPLSSRLEKLTTLQRALQAPFLVETASAQDLASKKSLYEKLHTQKKEGIIFKLKSSVYTPGRPASGGTQLKHKFYATASFVVAAVNNKRSVALGLYKEGTLVKAGNVTISINFDIPEEGDIVEVRYLYAFKESGSVYQPVYLGKRVDLDYDDCIVSQLKYKADQEEE